jgi:hypothetical protein
VPQQSSVFVDLLPGYEASLVIDDIALETVSLDELGGLAEPGQQITLPPKAVFEPATSRSRTPRSKAGRSSRCRPASTRRRSSTGSPSTGLAARAATPGRSTSSERYVV